MRIWLCAWVMLIVLIHLSQAQTRNNFTKGIDFDKLQSSLLNRNLKAVVVTVVRPNEREQLPLPLRYIFVVAYDSLLYLEPFTRFYTYLTITKDFYFGKLELTPEALAQNYDYKNGTTNGYLYNQTTPIIRAFMNETNVMRASSPAGNLSICWINPDSMSNYLTSFYCLRFNRRRTPELVLFNENIRYQDVTFLFFQMVVTAGIVYLYVTHMNMIRKSRKFIFVTDSIRNPPMWQCLFPLKTNWLAAFRIWDSINIIFFHVILCITTMLSQIQPRNWPDENGEIERQWKDAFNNVESYSLLGVVVVINTLIFLGKLGADNFRHKFVRIDKTGYGRKSKIVRILLTLFCTAIVVTCIMIYFFFGLATQRDYRRAVWITGTMIFCVILFFNLYGMNIYVHRGIGNWIVSKTKGKAAYVPEIDERYVELSAHLNDTHTFEDIVKQSQATRETLDMVPWVHILFIIWNYLVRSIWLITTVIMTFSSGYVFSKFIESTIANILINSDLITTYSYIFSICGVLYKFLIDVETPYTRLKNMIVRERSAACLERVVPYRKFLTTITHEAIREEMLVHNTYAYLIPMTWTVFFRISKIMRVTRFCYRSIIQMAFTVFILCVFYFASQIYNTEFSKAVSGNATLTAVIAGTVMPLIPKLISYFTENEAGMDSQIYSVRLQNALKLLERQEEKRNKIQFVAGSIPHKWIPFKYVLLSALKEESKEKMDPLYEYDIATNAATIIPDEKPVEEQTEQELEDQKVL